MKMSKKRNWQFTLNQVEKYNELANYLKSKKSLVYLISCKEISPKTNHIHIHIFAHFKNLFGPNIKRCCGAHIEPCNGTIKQNIDYIKKLKNENDEIIEEYGDIPNTDENMEEEKLTIKKIKKMNNEERENLPAIYYNIVQKINDVISNNIHVDDFYKEVKVIYIWGKSSIGKTKLAYKIISYLKETNKDKYSYFNLIKFINNFWIGTGDAAIALYDDFRDAHMKPSEFINFIDYSKQLMNIKYGSKRNNYEIIIITSVQNPEHLYLNYDDEEQKEQWIRRLNIIYLKEQNDFNLINIKNLFNV